MPPLARNIGLNVLARLDRRNSGSRSIERRSAVVTKFRSGFIGRAAARTFCHHRRSAFAAKLRALGIFRRTILAAHRLTSRPGDSNFIYHLMWGETMLATLRSTQ